MRKCQESPGRSAPPNMLANASRESRQIPKSPDGAGVTRVLRNRGSSPVSPGVLTLCCEGYPLLSDSWNRIAINLETELQLGGTQFNRRT
jgi:hypothetical protein